jgi:hypothetical protein
MAKVLFRNTLTSEEEGSIQGNGRPLRPVFATGAVIGKIFGDEGKVWPNSTWVPDL